MTRIDIDLSMLSGIDPETVNLATASIDFSPFVAYEIEDGEWLTRSILKVKCPGGIAAPELPPTPTGRGYEVQERGFRGARHGYIVVPDQESIDYSDIQWVTKDSLDPVEPADPAWLLAWQGTQDQLDALSETVDELELDLDAEEAARIAADAVKQPLNAKLTDIAGLTLTEGQVAAWSVALGQLAAANQPGGSRLAVAQPIAAAQAIPHNGGTAVLLTSTSISVGDSGGRPVSLRFGGTFSQTVVGTGTAYLVVKETTSGAVDIAVNTKNLPNSIAVQLAGITWGTQDADIGVVTTTRTFALYSLIFPASGSPTMSVLKTATNPLFLKAIPE